MIRRPPRSTRTDTLFPAATLCYPSPDGASGHPVPLERPHARPRAAGDIPALPVAPVPRRPAVRIRRRTVVHDGVRAGAAVDGGVWRAVHVPGFPRLARSEERRVGLGCSSTCT